MNKLRRPSAQTILIGVLALLIVLRIGQSADPTSRLFASLVKLPAQSIKVDQRKLDTSKPLLALPSPCKPLDAMVQRRNLTPYQHELQIDMGMADGVVDGQLVVGHEGLVGRIARTSAHDSWAQLISDPTFRLSVQIDGVTSPAILKGNGSSIVIDRILAEGELSGRSVVSLGVEAGAIVGLPVGALSGEQKISELNGLRRFTLATLEREEYLRQVRVCRAGAAS